MHFKIKVTEDDKTLQESDLSELTLEKFVALELAYADFGERLQDLRKLMKLRKRLIDQKIWYQEGKVSNMKTRQNRLHSRLQYFEDSLQKLQAPTLEVKAFILGELDATEWQVVNLFKKPFWSWASSWLSDVGGPPKPWMECLRDATKEASLRQPKIYDLRSGM